MQIQISATSIPGSDAPNEDYYLASNTWGIVLDGITRYPDDGCIHDVPWYVRQLGSAIASQIDNQDLDLHAVLNQAIEVASNQHRDTCDLKNPVSPGATVAIARFSGKQIAWLVLGDSSVVWHSTDGKIYVKSDERLSQLVNPPVVEDVAGIRRLPVKYIAEVRNQPGGFWVASAKPDAAKHALSGSIETTEPQKLILCTDGITRLVEHFGYQWDELFRMVDQNGVSALTSLVRKEETRNSVMLSSSKPHDDATGLYLQIH